MNETLRKPGKNENSDFSVRMSSGGKTQRPAVPSLYALWFELHPGETDQIVGVFIQTVLLSGF